MKYILCYIFILFNFFLCSCDEQKKKITRIDDYSDSLYTIKTEIKNKIYPVDYRATFTDYIHSEEYRLIRNIASNKISIQFSKEKFNYIIETKKFGDEYRSFFLKWKNLPNDMQLSKWKDSVTCFSNMDSISVRKIIPYFNGKTEVIELRGIIIDYGRDIRNLDFFNKIELNE